ncbi:substrate-binding periplasmic protein [Ideonella sp.]|uniref:substrate-binding periplasmic protein n=1 Tax=Ideonella sp. TaxID=1929293 RepID=UPI0035B4D440
MKFWAVWVGLGCAAVAAPGAAEVLRLATGELPPYATEARADQGVALRIVREALRTQGHEVVYTFMPWGRALEETRAGKWDGTAYWGHKPEHEKSFLLSDNVLTEQWVVLYRAPLQVDWTQPEDLAALTFGAIKTYTYTPEFHALFASGRLKVDWSPDDISILHKLAAGRVDATLLDRNVACYLIDRHLTGAEARMIRAHPRLMTSNFTTHLMLPKALPQSPARLEAMNKGLAALRASGEYRRLLEFTECKVGLAMPVMPK